MASYIYVGDQIVAPIFFEEDGARDDPSSVTFRVTDPSAASVDHPYGTSDIVARLDVGSYTGTIRPTSAGTWSYTWIYVTDGGTQSVSGTVEVRDGGNGDEAGGTLATFEGISRPALITTGEVQPNTLNQTLVNELWPEIDVDVTDVIGQVTTRAQTYMSDMNDFGVCHVRLSARHFKLGVEIAAGVQWTEAIGMHWRGSAGGER